MCLYMCYLLMFSMQHSRMLNIQADQLILTSVKTVNI